MWIECSNPLGSFEILTSNITGCLWSFLPDKTAKKRKLSKGAMVAWLKPLLWRKRKQIPFAGDHLHWGFKEEMSLSRLHMGNAVTLKATEHDWVAFVWRTLESTRLDVTATFSGQGMHLFTFLLHQHWWGSAANINYDPPFAGGWNWGTINWSETTPSICVRVWPQIHWVVSDQCTNCNTELLTKQENVQSYRDHDSRKSERIIKLLASEFKPVSKY